MKIAAGTEVILLSVAAGKDLLGSWPLVDGLRPGTGITGIARCRIRTLR